MGREKISLESIEFVHKSKEIDDTQLFVVVYTDRHKQKNAYNATEQQLGRNKHSELSCCLYRFIAALHFCFESETRSGELSVVIYAQAHNIHITVQTNQFFLQSGNEQ